MECPAARILLALALLMFLQRGRSRPCPRMCSCPQPTEVHCTFRSLVTIPSGIPKDVERINFGFNSITGINDRSLAGLRKLELLMVHGNDVHALPDGAFRDLSSLQMLKLSYNKLRQISRQTLQGLWSLARLHLDHNRLEFIHPDTFQGLTSLRVLQLEGNRLRQLHPTTFATFSLLSHFHVSTLRHLYLSENRLTSLPPGLLETAPQLEILHIHGNPWRCDCHMSWLRDWDRNSPGVLKCKKDKASPGGQLCPTCSFPGHLQGKELQALEEMVCGAPVIISPLRTIKMEEPESEVMTPDTFREPLGNITLDLSDEHGNKVDLACVVGEPREVSKVNWEQVSQHSLAANVTWSVDLDCPIDRENYERLWRLIAYYSDVPAHLQRDMMLSKEPQLSYRYKQDMERDAQYFTGVKVTIMSQPTWLMQSHVGLRLDRPQSTGQKVKLVLSAQLSQRVEAEVERRRGRTWVMIESTNTTHTAMSAVVGGTSLMRCNMQSSGKVVLHWVTPDGSRLEAPYSSLDGRVSASSDGKLLIKSIDHSDTGVYYCVAKVHGDLDILPFRLAVEESSSPPPGDEQPQPPPIQGYAGESIALPCVASGFPNAEINWILPGGNVVSTRTNSTRAAVYSNGTLRLLHGNSADSGYYKCVAINQYGMVTLATKVTVTKRVTKGLIRTVRKFTKRPQSASGFSTKIKVPTVESVEGSGAEGVVKVTSKTQVNLLRRRVQIARRRVGHPSRNTWRRPALPRKPMQPRNEDRKNTVETRRRFNTAGNKIDPQKWANILAKVRDRTAQSSVTPNMIRQNTESKQTTETPDHTMQPDDNMEGSSEAGALQEEQETVDTLIIPTTNDVLGTPSVSPSTHKTRVTSDAHTVHVTPMPSKAQNTQTTSNTQLTQSTHATPYKRVTHSAHTTAATEDATQNRQGTHSTQMTRDIPQTTLHTPVASSDPHIVSTSRLPLLQPTSAQQNSLTNWQTNTNRASGRGSVSYDNFLQGSRDTNTDVEFVTAYNMSLHTQKEPSTGFSSDKGKELSTDQSQLYSPVAPTQPLSVEYLSQAATESSLDLVPAQTQLIVSSTADRPVPTLTAKTERGREGPVRFRRPNSKRKNGGRRKSNRRRQKLNGSPPFITTITPADAPLATTSTAAPAPLKIEPSERAVFTAANFTTAVPFTSSQATSSGRVSHKESTVPRHNNGATARPFSPPDDSLDTNDGLGTAATSSFATTTALEAGQGEIGPQNVSHIAERESMFLLEQLNKPTSAGRQSFTSSTLPPIKLPLDTHSVSVTGDRGLALLFENSPGSAHTPPQDVKQNRSGHHYTHFQEAEIQRAATVQSLPSSPTPATKHDQITSSSEHKPSGTGTTAGGVLEDVWEKHMLTSGGCFSNECADPSSDPTNVMSAVSGGGNEQVKGAIHMGVNVVNSSPSTVASVPLLTPTMAMPISHMATSSNVPPITTPLTTLGPEGPGFNHIPDGHRERAHSQDRELPLHSSQGESQNATRSGANRTLAAPPFETQPNQEAVLRLGPNPTPPASKQSSAYPFKHTTTYVPTATSSPPSVSQRSTSRAVLPSREDQSVRFPTLTEDMSRGHRLPGPVSVPRGKPRITSPDSQTIDVNAETDAHLPCEAIGQPPPFLSWTKVSTGVSVVQNTKVHRYEVHPNGTLIIRNTQPTDRGQYLCTVQNQHGQDRLAVHLVVLLQHPRVLQPRHRDVTVHLGANIDLECTVRGHPPPRVTWVLPDQVHMAASALSVTAPSQRMALLGNGTLRISQAVEADRGMYRCLGTSVAGADAVSVRLHVSALPPVILQASRQNVSFNEGMAAYIHCSANGAPPPVVRWMTPDGVQLAAAQFIKGRNLLVFPNGTLHVRGVVLGNVGRYECTASNVVAASTRTVFLSVLRANPSSTKARIGSSSPQRTDMIYGGTLKLDCLASGQPKPRIIWRTPTKKLVDSQYSYDPRIQVFPNGTLAIRSVTEKDAGDFLCLARNRAGDDYVLLRVNVLTRPAKIEQKQLRSSQEVVYGGHLKVDCVASGLPDPDITWALPDGTMVNSDKVTGRGSSSRTRRYVVFDNGTLYFNDVGMREEGDYTCYAENQLGKDEMKVRVKVKVAAEPPHIRDRGHRMIGVFYGEAVSLHCRAVGEPAPLVSWISPINRVVSPVSGKYLLHDNGTLVVQKVQRSDGGNYTCMARNGAGQDRNVLTVEVLVTPPTINGLKVVSDAVGVMAVQGQRKLLDCVAMGTPLPRVMWVLPGNIILPVPYHSSRMMVHPNGTLDLRVPRRDDSGQLTCIARNEGGEARLTVNLNVQEAVERPQIRGPKADSLSLTVGNTMILNCSFEGLTVPQVTWILPNGAPLLSGSRLSKFFHRPDGSLVIGNPSMAEAGMYRCLGRNAGGLVERTVTVSPGGKPEIGHRYSSPVSVMNGEPLWLHCPTGGEPLRLTWTLPSGVVLGRPQRAGRYAVLPNGTLSIQQASIYDRGSYVCRAANEYGSALSPAQVVVMAYPPRIADGPPSVTYARRGVAIQLNCVASGNPKVEVAWETPDRTRLSVGTQPRLFGNKYVHPQGALVIQNPTQRDAGVYRCTARNAIGVDSKATYLNVF